MMTKSLFYIVFLLSQVFCSLANGQNINLSPEQYEVINALYSNGDKRNLPLFNQTIDYISWTRMLSTSNFKDSYSTCGIISDPSFPDIVAQLEMEVQKISPKRIEPDKLDFKVKLFDKSTLPHPQGLWSISEPIILNKYAFIFHKSRNSEMVQVFLKIEDQWTWQCFIDIYTVFYD